MDPPDPDVLMVHPEPPGERELSEMGHPGFSYDAAPELFLGRRGEGPLVLAFDTNVVVLLTQRFDDVVGGLGFVGLGPSRWEEPDFALRDLFAVWFWRHVAVHISELMLDDAKRRLSAERHALRLRTLTTFAHDRWLRGSDIELEQQAVAGLPAVGDLPAGRDGELVRDAVAAGAHAFITFDKGILRFGPTLEPWRLRLCEPSWLLRTLGDAGEFSILSVDALPPVADLLMLSELYGLLADDES